MDAAPPPCTIGLTGGLASGKSTVARRLQLLGAAVLDADAVVHELYAAGGEGAREVKRLFGAAVLDARGSVDRQALGRVVLDDPEAMRRLNEAVHPLVRRSIDRWMEELAAAADPPMVAVVEAALLVETGGADRYDLLVVVWCTREQQILRAGQRGMAEDRIRGLLARQAPLSTKRELADVVVDNTGDPGELEIEVERAWREILTLCTRRRAHSDGGSSQSVA